MCHRYRWRARSGSRLRWGAQPVSTLFLDALILDQVPVVFANRGKYVEVQHRLAAGRLAVVHDVGRNARHASGTALDHPITDHEAHRSADDVGELLVRM